jgi:hypothetical protein
MWELVTANWCFAPYGLLVLFLAVMSVHESIRRPTIVTEGARLEVAPESACVSVWTVEGRRLDGLRGVRSTTEPCSCGIVGC